MKDFEEIGHSGGKIEIEVNEKWFAFKISHNNACACKIHNINVQVEGLNIPIYMLSDEECMFGQKCRNCNTYYRVSSISENPICPYCEYSNSFNYFNTDNQQTYINDYLNKVMFHIFSRTSGIIEFDKVVDGISNKKTYSYSNERQQTVFSCASCNVKHDIIGKYAVCSKCGVRNTLTMYIDLSNRSIKKLENIEHDEILFRDIHENIVSNFEALAKDLFSVLKKKHPEFAKEKISFQRISDAQESIFRLFSIDLFQGLDIHECRFINDMFQRRHLYAHNDGIVDQNFINKLIDKKSDYRIGQLLRTEKSEIIKFNKLMNVVSSNFWRYFE